MDILALRVTPTSTYAHGDVRGGWQEASVYRSMRLHVPVAAVGPRAVVSSAPAPDSNQRQAAAGAGDTARRGVPREAPPARPRKFERAAGRAADRAADPLRHLAAGAGCEGKRISQAIAAMVELSFQLKDQFH